MTTPSPRILVILAIGAGLAVFSFAEPALARPDRGHESRESSAHRNQRPEAMVHPIEYRRHRGHRGDYRSGCDIHVHRHHVHRRHVCQPPRYILRYDRCGRPYRVKIYSCCGRSERIYGRHRLHHRHRHHHHDRTGFRFEIRF